MFWLVSFGVHGPRSFFGTYINIILKEEGAISCLTLYINVFVDFFSLSSRLGRPS